MSWNSLCGPGNKYDKDKYLTDFFYSDNIKPIVLPSGSLTENKFVGEEAEASGYGATSDSNTFDFVIVFF